jgi:hypothetical protein
MESKEPQNILMKEQDFGGGAHSFKVADKAIRIQREFRAINHKTYISELRAIIKILQEENMELSVNCYWRFKGDKEYKYGFPTKAEKGLIRMGLWNGDYVRGPLVDRKDIEVKDEI